MANTLKPCPFCGLSKTVKRMTYAEAYEVDTEDDPYADNEFVVVCAVTEGGCGASGGCAVASDEAERRWNKRKVTPDWAQTLASHLRLVLSMLGPIGAHLGACESAESALRHYENTRR